MFYHSLNDYQTQSIQVFRIEYCVTFFPEEADIHCHTCLQFVNSVLRTMPELGKRLKIHLLLHLVDNILAFGPSSSFNTERYIHMQSHATCLSFIFSTDSNLSTLLSEGRIYIATAVLPVGT